MDFFDPQKQKKHARRLVMGYALIGVVLMMATTILLHHAYGFGIDRHGQIIRNGMVFVSSRPSSASIYLDGEKRRETTNARLNIPSGQYLLELKREGYRDWKRVLTVEGGSVSRFDYPLLFPVDLATDEIKQYEAAPGFVSSSIDRRWILAGAPNQNSFDLFDMNVSQPVAAQVSVPAEALAAETSTTNWEVAEWAKDNRHVVLKRHYDNSGEAGTEYILFDRQEPERSQNLNVLFGFNPTSLELRDQSHDQYYLYDESSRQLLTATLEEPALQLLASDVIDYTTEKDIVTYVTTENAEPGEAFIKLKEQDNEPFVVRNVAASDKYLLEMADYGGAFYLAVGSAAENRVFLFEDPISSLKSDTDDVLVPIQILKVASPSHVSFSANKRFAIIQNGNQFAVYDIETDRGYAYQTSAPMDDPQARATWMDGFRLSYVSEGKVVVFDYDGTNLQDLSNAQAGFRPIFDNDYRYMYTFDQQNRLTRTALLAPADL